MPLIFHYSKINLNITSKSIRSGLPLRIFDILGCGGFLLTNYQPELSNYFTPGYDLVCYSSEDELLEKTEYYLSHEKERIETIFNCLRNHFYHISADYLPVHTSKYFSSPPRGAHPARRAFSFIGRNFL